MAARSSAAHIAHAQRLAYYDIEFLYVALRTVKLTMAKCWTWLGKCRVLAWHCWTLKGTARCEWALNVQFHY